MNRWHVMQLAVAAALLLLLAASAGCRKRTPDELVYQGKAKATPATTSTTPRPAPVIPPPPPPPTKPFSKRALLEAIADCAVTHTRAFETVVIPLRDAASAHAAQRTPQTAEASQNAWRAATAVWQEVELFRFGPGAALGHPGGRDLRDQINAWPLFSRCKVDEQIVATSYSQAPFASTSLVNGRGLAALEYLAFSTAAGNGCTEVAAINTQGSWNALGGDELARRRADYAAVVAGAVAERARELAAAWDPSRENFRAQVATAGSGSTVFATEQAALNAISDGLFFIDKEVKDSKLGRPAGLFECAADTCPQGLESSLSRTSLQNVRANLRGFRRVFQGCGDGFAGFGFDDWLGEVGAKDVSDRMLAALALVESTLTELEPSLEDVIAQDPARARVLHADLKTLTDVLKTEFVTVLNLELPKVAEGDND